MSALSSASPSRALTPIPAPSGAAPVNLVRPATVAPAPHGDLYCAGLTAVLMMTLPFRARKYGGYQQEHPRQLDWPERVKLITVSAKTFEPVRGWFSSVPRTISQEETNFTWLMRGEFALILSAGFVGGLFKAAGFIDALEEAGVFRRVSTAVGASSGFIIASLFGTLPKDQAKKELLALMLSDFLNPSNRLLSAEGALCTGNELERKFDKIFATKTLKDAHPPIKALVFNLTTRKTEIVEDGLIRDVARESASLPGLFVPKKRPDGTEVIDGGWEYQQASLAQEPHKRSLTYRIEAGATGWSAWTERQLVGRPEANNNVSDDPEHLTLMIQTSVDVSMLTFAIDISRNLPKLEKIVEESRKLTLKWLHAPKTVLPPAKYPEELPARP